MLVYHMVVNDARWKQRLAHLEEARRLAIEQRQEQDLSVSINKDQRSAESSQQH